MPSDGSFGFAVLIAGRPVPEYASEGTILVESNLNTPVSYFQEVDELVNGEREVQLCPVTPYQILVHLEPHCDTSAIFVYVDGVKVSKFVMEKNQSRILKGFEEKSGVREFLFALPSFSKSKDEHIDGRRKGRIGSIEVVRHQGQFVRDEYRAVSVVDFNQASKNDALSVTNGKYTMSTTKKGKYIRRSKPYNVQLKKMWKMGRESGRLSVQYRMGHTLEDLGMKLRPIDWSKGLPSPKHEPKSSTSSETDEVERVDSHPSSQRIIAVRTSKSSSTSSSTSSDPEDMVVTVDLPSSPERIPVVASAEAEEASSATASVVRVKREGDHQQHHQHQVCAH